MLNDGLSGKGAIIMKFVDGCALELVLVMRHPTKVGLIPSSDRGFSSQLDREGMSWNHCHISRPSSFSALRFFILEATALNFNSIVTCKPHAQQMQQIVQIPQHHHDVKS